MSYNITFLKEWIRANPNTDLTIGILTDAMESFENYEDVSRVNQLRRLNSVYICNHISSSFRPNKLLLEIEEFEKLGYNLKEILNKVEYTLSLIHRYRPTSKLFQEIYNHPSYNKHDDKYRFNGIMANTFWDLSKSGWGKIPKEIALEKVKYLKLLINMLKSSNTIGVPGLVVE